MDDKNKGPRLESLTVYIEFETDEITFCSIKGKWGGKDKMDSSN